MGSHVTSRFLNKLKDKKIKIKQARILIMGLTFKKIVLMCVILVLKM